MPLTYSFGDVPFLNRTDRITDPETIKRFETQGAPRDWYVIAEGDEDQIPPGVYMMTQATQALIFLTMSVEIGRITEKNWREFYGRVHAEEKLNGPRRWRRKSETDTTSVPIYFTPQEIYDHIGLGTNVSKKSEAKWRKNLLDHWMRTCAKSCDSITKGAEATAELLRIRHAHRTGGGT